MKIWLPCIATGTGAEVWTRRLAAGLAARGHDIRLDLIAHRYQYLPWAAPVREPAGCDVALANSWTGAAFARRAPLVSVVHHVIHDPVLAPFKTPPQALFHRAFVKPMERAAIARARTVVAVSRTTAAAIAHHLGHGDAQTVLNGIDTAFFCPDPRPTRPVRPGAPLELLFVGKPSRRKGFDLVARLASALGDAARLTVVGPPAEPGLAQPPGRRLGRVSAEALRDAYRAADFVLLPSRVEGFGFAAAEAMACGTPVVCAPGGAVAEIARPGEAALTLAEDDLDGLAHALLSIQADPARHAAMRAAARTIAVRDLAEERWLDGMEAVLEGATRG